MLEHIGKKRRYWEMEQRRVKKYVQVVASFSLDGKLIPLHVIWEDGRKFEVDQVKGCLLATNRKTGGKERRYTCMISGREASLYYEENDRWFVEAKA